MSGEAQDPEEDDVIAMEAGAPLPAREVMSIVDPASGVNLFPGEPIDPVDPGITTGQGMDERLIPE